MSEKEQVEALALLREWLEFETASGVASVDQAVALMDKRRALVEKTKGFLTLGAGPESHGRRRS